MCFVHAEHLKSSGCKRPSLVADDDAQLEGLLQEKEDGVIQEPMISGSSVSLDSSVTGCP